MARIFAAVFSAGALLATFAGCSVSERFLVPREAWIAEPDAAGLAFEEVELATGAETSVHGWFIPAAGAADGTVLICHGNGANISFYHPYYRFLHEGGLNVFLFDYRGYGKSRGELDVDALFSDALAAFDHLVARDDVDPDRIVVFGTSLGAIVALKTVAERPSACGVIVENAASPRAAVDAELGPIAGWLVATFALPGGIEPAETAARYEGPTLFLSGANDPALIPHLEAAAAAAGDPVATWVMPETGHAPAGMLTHDGEYQDAILGFALACSRGEPAALEVALEEVADETATVRLARSGEGGGEGPLAVEVCLVDAEGVARFERRWMRDAEERWRLAAPGSPRFVAAHAYRRVRPEGDAWVPRPGPLAPASRLVPHVEALSHIAAQGEDPVAAAGEIVAVLAAFETEHGPFPDLAATVCIPAFERAAAAAAEEASDDGRAVARVLLRRCLDAEPAVPALHHWPASAYRAGFTHQAELERARALLATLDAR